MIHKTIQIKLEVETVKGISLSDSNQSHTNPKTLYKMNQNTWTNWIKWIWSYEQCTTRFFKEKKKQNFTTYIWPKCLTSNGNSGESGWSPLTRATNLSTHSALNNLNFHVTEFTVLCRLVSYVEFFSLIFSDKHGLPLDSVTWIKYSCLFVYMGKHKKNWQAWEQRAKNKTSSLPSQICRR